MHHNPVNRWLRSPREPPCWPRLAAWLNVHFEKTYCPLKRQRMAIGVERRTIFAPKTVFRAVINPEFNSGLLVTYGINMLKWDVWIFLSEMHLHSTLRLSMLFEVYASSVPAACGGKARRLCRRPPRDSTAVAVANNADALAAGLVRRCKHVLQSVPPAEYPANILISSHALDCIRQFDISLDSVKKRRRDGVDAPFCKLIANIPNVTIDAERFLNHNNPPVVTRLLSDVGRQNVTVISLDLSGFSHFSPRPSRSTSTACAALNVQGHSYHSDLARSQSDSTPPAWRLSVRASTNIKSDRRFRYCRAVGLIF